MNTEDYKKAFLDYLDTKVLNITARREPENLYAPIHYILQLGGKRLRPVLTLLSCDIFSGDYRKALDAGLAIEMFHNFTLMHDDIMDEASIRRGKTTVHKKWDVNTGILSGDALMILAYQLFENYSGDTFKNIVSLFNKTAIEVCEGQQYDMDFETRNDVGLDEYLKMIGFKTAVLVAAALKMGAIVAGADDEQAAKIYDFGFHLGMAFQLQDDYLDTFGGENFGKKIGGDIIENKKTFLVIKTRELADEPDVALLDQLFSSELPNEEKIEKVRNLFIKYGVDEVIKKEIQSYTEKAYKDADQLRISEDSKKVLLDFANDLMYRKL